MTNLEGHLSAKQLDGSIRGDVISQSFISLLKKEILQDKEAPLHLKRDAEAIGHVLVAARKETEQTARSAAKLSRSELLRLSASIEINGGRLIDIYNNHLIGENGLRRIVEAFEKGANLAEQLKIEITEHDIDYERDPNLRDMSPLAYVTDNDSDQDNDLSYSKLIAKAEASLIGVDSEPNLYTDNNQGRLLPKEQVVNSGHSYDRLLMSVIVFLTAAILYIYLIKK